MFFCWFWGEVFAWHSSRQYRAEKFFFHRMSCHQIVQNSAQNSSPCTLPGSRLYLAQLQSHERVCVIADRRRSGTETVIEDTSQAYTLWRCVLKESWVFCVICGGLKLQISMLLPCAPLYLARVSGVKPKKSGCEYTSMEYCANEMYYHVTRPSEIQFLYSSCQHLWLCLTSVSRTVAEL